MEHVYVRTSNDVSKVPNVRSEAHVTLLDSAKKIQSNMDIKGHLSVSYGPMISGEGAGTYMMSNSSTKEAAVLIYRSKKVKSSSSLSSPKLTDEAKMLATTNIYEFAKNYGTMYVSQIHYGAQLEIKFELAYSENVKKENIEAELKGKIGFGITDLKFSAEFKQKAEEFEKKHQVKCTVKATGADTELPGSPSLHDIVKIIDKFNKAVAVLREEQMTPIALVLDSIKVEQFDDIQLQSLEEKMNKNSKVFIESTYWIVQLDAAKKDIEGIFSSPKGEDLCRAFFEEIGRHVKELDAKKEDCLKYRGKSLDDILAKQYPITSYLTPENKLRLKGLVGERYIKGKEGDGFSDYDGYTMEIDGKLKPVLVGKFAVGNQMPKLVSSLNDLEISPGNESWGPYFVLAQDKAGVRYCLTMEEQKEVEGHELSIQARHLTAVDIRETGILFNKIRIDENAFKLKCHSNRYPDTHDLSVGKSIVIAGQQKNASLCIDAAEVRKFHRLFVW